MKRVGAGLSAGSIVASLVICAGLARGAEPAPPVTKEGSATFRKVVKQTLPAVVSISSINKPDPKVNQDRLNEAIRRFEAIYGKMSPAQRQNFIEQFEQANDGGPEYRGFGSGVIVSPEGVILTNNHVVEEANVVLIRFQDGRQVESAQILRDPKTDLAIVKLKPEDAKDLAVAALGDSDKAEIGDWVLAMGSPFGLTGTVTAGIISAKGRTPPELNMLYKDFIQTDAQINPGNSGGPIVNLDGEVVGINTAIRSSTGEFSGVAFSIPSNMARHVVKELVEHGRVRRGYLGIQMAEAPPEELKKLGIDHGVVITGMVRGQTPARRAGLKPSDVIVKVGDEDVKTSRQLQDIVTHAPTGSTVSLTVQREGAGQIQVPVQIDEQPEDFGTVLAGGPRNLREFLQGPNAKTVIAVKIEKLGIAVTQGEDGGLLVAEVDEDSPGARAGLKPGMLIVEAERKPVTTWQEFAEAIEGVDLAAKGALLKVQTPDGNRLLIVVNQ